MSKCTCFHSTGLKEITPWRDMITSAQLEQIRKNFASVKPMNEKPFALPKSNSSAVPVKPSPVVVEFGPGRPFYTGYARIDNAITDALKGKSQELKDSVYDIIRSDFLPNNVHGVEEADRLARISLGVEKAEYLAGQFMDAGTRASFMDAMRSIARIGTEGKRVGSCKMEYQVENAVCVDGNGYVHEDGRGEYLYAMEKYSPETYAEYQKLLNASGDDTTESAMFALKWAISNLDLVAAGRQGYRENQDKEYEKLYQVELDDTFSGSDTRSKEHFLASIKEKLMANRELQINLFMDQIAQMAKAPGGYLTARRMILSGRA